LKKRLCSEIKAQQLVDKVMYQAVIQKKRKNKSEYCPGQVRVVVYVISLAPAHEMGIHEVKQSHDYPRNWQNAVKIDEFPGPEKNEKESNG